MDFSDQIKALASRIPSQIEYCQTEEATKTALIMPFINALGYDVFNPTEVVPEYTADIGSKKGEKVDYAVMLHAEPAIFFECKWAGADLSTEHAAQLRRYFNSVPQVRFGVVTNGVVYRFFSDLDAPNRMDPKAFFEFDMLNFHDRDIVELKKFTKSAFNLENILTTASELKYAAAVRKIVAQEFDEPSEGFVRFFASQVYSGRMTQQVREQFADITKMALRTFMNDQINERLQTALGGMETQATAEEDLDELEDLESTDVTKRGIVTTEEEIEGFFVVKSILRDTLDVKRIHIRDTKSYCGILLDDNNRKPVCRLHFNRTQLYIGLFGDDRKETRKVIDSVDDIYQYSDQIVATVVRYEED